MHIQYTGQQELIGLKKSFLSDDPSFLSILVLLSDIKSNSV